MNRLILVGYVLLAVGVFYVAISTLLGGFAGIGWIGLYAVGPVGIGYLLIFSAMKNEKEMK